MEHLTYISYVHVNEKGNNVQCVQNVRVTYLVYVVLCDKIVIGIYIHVQLRYMATYDQWYIWRTFHMYLEIKMATMFSAVINVRLTSNVYEVRPGQIAIWKCREISVVYVCPHLKKKNLLRRQSDFVSFMMFQNQYKKCDYCLLFFSSFCVACVLFLLLSNPS